MLSFFLETADAGGAAFSPPGDVRRMFVEKRPLELNCMAAVVDRQSAWVSVVPPMFVDEELSMLIVDRFLF